MNTLDILRLEGVVVRKIPLTTTSRYTDNPQNRASLQGREGVEFVNIDGRSYIRETRQNRLGGKYILTFSDGQDSLVRFSAKTDGIGDTIEAAYVDYKLKH